MKNNFIQMAASAGHVVAYTIGQQIIVQRHQIAAPRWPNDISSAADNAIFIQQDGAKHRVKRCPVDTKCYQYPPL